MGKREMEKKREMERALLFSPDAASTHPFLAFLSIDRSSKTPINLQEPANQTCTTEKKNPHSLLGIAPLHHLTTTITTYLIIQPSILNLELLPHHPSSIFVLITTIPILILMDIKPLILLSPVSQ